MKKTCSVASAYNWAWKNTTLNSTQPTIPAGQVCTLLRAAKATDSVATALAAISSGVMGALPPASVARRPWRV